MASPMSAGRSFGLSQVQCAGCCQQLIWGLDHRIYGAGGTNGGTITSPDRSDAEKVVISRHDFGSNPRDRSFELQSGSARFGNTFDDWGHRFICNIRNPIQHVLLPHQYLARNPLLPVASALNDVASAGDQIRVYRASPPEPWRVVNAERLTTQAIRACPAAKRTPRAL